MLQVVLVMHIMLRQMGSIDENFKLRSQQRKPWRRHPVGVDKGVVDC